MAGHSGHHEHGGHHRRGAHPRSPRQVIAPERMPPPPSRRARHPLVVVGNAILTIIVLLIVAAGIGLYVGKSKFDAAGPLDRERAVIIGATSISPSAMLRRLPAKITSRRFAGTS